nr:unnamed protein product [Digitaria exilis]
MGDDVKGKSADASLAATEKEHRELMAALLKKFDVLNSLEERLGRMETTQQQMVHFTYDESSVTLQMPPPYSVVIQVMSRYMN